MAKRYHGGIKLSDAPVFPKEVMFHECSDPYQSLKINYRDDLSGIDQQIGEDTRDLHRGLDPQKV
jgi:hypothetical protein